MGISSFADRFSPAEGDPLGASAPPVPSFRWGVDEGRYLRVLDGSGLVNADVGGKAASLDRLVGAGFAIPPAVAITTEAYRAFITRTGLDAQLTRVLAGPIPPPDVAEAVHRRLEQAFLEAAMPDDLTAALLPLAEALGDAGAVSVRSSATAEDLAGASFAGQYLSVLNVRGLADMLTAVVRVWASLWHPAARSYRRQLEIGEDDLAMGVIVQRMVAADRSGVVFTKDPILPGALRLEVVDGLGEQLVSGETTPSVHQLRRPGLRPIDGTEIDPALRSAAHTALLIEERFGGQPQDVEWSVVDDKLWVLQARPITTLAFVSEETDDGFDTAMLPEDRYVAAGVQEMLPGVIPPLVWTINAPMVEEAFRKMYDDLGALTPHLVMPFGYIGRQHGRATLNLTAVQQASRQMAGWSPDEVERFYLGGPPSGDEPKPAERRRRLREFTASLRAFRLRRTAKLEAEAFIRSARAVVARDADVRALLDSELVAYRWRTRDLAASGVRAEVAVAAAAVAAYTNLENVLTRWLGDEGAGWAQRVTRDAGQGAATPLTIAGALLAELDEPARSVVAAALADPGPPTLDDALEASGPEGCHFLAELHVEMRRLGSAAVYAGRTWREQPEFVRTMLAGQQASASFPKGGTATDLIELERKLTRNWRWRLTRIMTGQVVDLRRRNLHRLIADAGTLLGLREQAKAALLALGGEERRVLLELAMRMVDRGLLGKPLDVEMLADWELDELALGGATVPQAEIDRRRRVNEAWKAAPPPSVTEASWAERESGTAVLGWGASPGRHRGPVRVVTDPAAAGQIELGTVLVAPATDPSWVPLFQRAGALVIERGGPLSHAAIVAREFRLPAVLNVGGATGIFKDGDMVEVDGDRGSVTLLEASPAQEAR